MAGSIHFPSRLLRIATDFLTRPPEQFRLLEEKKARNSRWLGL